VQVILKQGKTFGWRVWRTRVHRGRCPNDIPATTVTLFSITVRMPRIEILCLYFVLHIVWIVGPEFLLGLYNWSHIIFQRPRESPGNKQAVYYVYIYICPIHPMWSRNEMGCHRIQLLSES